MSAENLRAARAKSCAQLYAARLSWHWLSALPRLSLHGCEIASVKTKVGRACCTIPKADIVALAAFSHWLNV